MGWVRRFLKASSLKNLTERSLSEGNMQSGIKYILISNLFSLFVEVSVKSLSHVPFYLIAFYRSIIVTLICVMYLRKLSIPLLGNNKKLLLVRGTAGTIALVLYFITLQNLPLALAITLQYYLHRSFQGKHLKNPNYYLCFYHL